MVYDTIENPSVFVGSVRSRDGHYLRRLYYVTYGLYPRDRVKEIGERYLDPTRL